MHFTICLQVYYKVQFYKVSTFSCAKIYYVFNQLN